MEIDLVAFVDAEGPVVRLRVKQESLGRSEGTRAHQPDAHPLTSARKQQWSEPR